MPSDTLSLAGKTALITGSGRENGLGAAIARAFARNGASIAIHHISNGSKVRAEKVAADITKEFGTKTTVVHGDVKDSATRIIEQTLSGLGVQHIDILVNNAGAVQYNPVLEAKSDQIEHEFGVNVFGVIYMTQAVAKYMPQGGRIINVGSIASKVLGPPGVYSASKAACDVLTTVFAGELGKSQGITVNTIAPGPVISDINREFLVTRDGSLTETSKAMIQQTRAADRLGTVEDIADAALLLVSEQSRWITGQFISVSGGITGI